MSEALEALTADDTPDIETIDDAALEADDVDAEATPDDGPSAADNLLREAARAQADEVKRTQMQIDRLRAERRAALAQEAAAIHDAYQQRIMAAVANGSQLAAAEAERWRRQKLDALEERHKQLADPDPASVRIEGAAEAFRKANPWLKEPGMLEAASAMVTTIEKEPKWAGKPPEQVLAEMKRRLGKATRPARSPAVEMPGRRSAMSTPKSFDGMPQEARKVFHNAVKRHGIKDTPEVRKKWAADYWSGVSG